MEGLGLVILFGIIIVAVVIRRRIRDPESAPGRWYKEHIKPREKEITTWFFVATLVLWAVLFVGASKEDKEKSDRALKDFKESFTPKKKPQTTHPPIKDGNVEK